MKNYEVTFIVDPVLSREEIEATAQTYVDHLKSEGCQIVHVDEMGLRQLAYPINRRTSGIYYCIEFEAPTGELIDVMELALRRDERIMRFLTVALDKYGVKYNADKRAGKIGKVKKKAKKSDDRKDNRRDNRKKDEKRKPAPKKEEAAPKKEEAAPKKEEAAPKKEEAAPKKEEAAPKKEQAAPKKEEAAPKKEQAAAKKEEEE